MSEVIFGYRKLIELISEEEQQAIRCIEGDLFEMYKDILIKEREKIERQMYKLY